MRYCFIKLLKYQEDATKEHHKSCVYCICVILYKILKTCVAICVRACVCVYVCVCMYVCVCIYIYRVSQEERT